MEDEDVKRMRKQQKKTYDDAASPIPWANPSTPDTTYFLPSLVADRATTNGGLHCYSRHQWKMR
jgi:hypothetical protein